MIDEEVCLFCGVAGNIDVDFAEPGCCNICIKTAWTRGKLKDTLKKEVSKNTEIPGSGLVNWDDD